MLSYIYCNNCKIVLLSTQCTLPIGELGVQKIFLIITRHQNYFFRRFIKICHESSGITMILVGKMDVLDSVQSSGDGEGGK